MEARWIPAGKQVGLAASCGKGDACHGATRFTGKAGKDVLWDFADSGELGQV